MLRLAALALIALAVSGQEAPMAPGPMIPYARPELPPMVEVAERRTARRLGRMAEAERADMPAWARGRVRALAGGVRRSEAAARVMEDGSTVLRFEVASEGATSVRVHFENFDVGGGKVWLYPAGATREYLAENPSAADGPVTGKGPHGDGEFWSKPIEGDAVIVELQLATNPAELPFEIRELAHETPERDSTLPCQRDVSCSPEFASMATAVGSYNVVKGQYLSYCSGALVVTRSRTFQPYFLTANHCVSTQTEARSVVVYWDFRSSSCNGPVPTRSSRPASRGARLLATAGMGGGDYTLLLLDEPAPGQRTYLGWSGAEVALGASTVGIHHPAAPPTNYQRITFGTRTADRTAIVGGEEAPASFYWQILESEGRTEQGSSGSPLLTRDGQVIGVLSYGPIPGPGQTYCDIQGRSGYGRFGTAFPAISQYLNDEAAPGLSVSATSFAFTVQDGAATPGAQRVEVRNSGAGTSGYNVGRSAGWIALSATVGTSSAATPGTFTIGVDPGQLTAPGTYEGVVTVTSGSLAPLNISVRATVGFTQAAGAITVSPNPVIETTPDEEGYNLFYTLRIDETVGVAARITRLVIDGSDRSADIVNFFGTAELPGFGGLAAPLRLRLTSLPRRRTIQISGVTVANGRTWSASTEVDFLPRPANARLALTAAPREVAQNDANANCRWRHELIIQETAGYRVDLNRWTAGDTDVSGRIAEFFGSTTLPANGLLRTTLCWTQVGTVPRLLTFEMGGVDEKGATVTVTGSVRIVGVTTSTATLGTSTTSIRERAAAGGDALLRRTFQVNVGADVLWTITPVISGAATDWIIVNPQRGRGPATVSVVLDPFFLTPGTYRGSLIVEAGATTPQFATVDVNFTAYRPLAGPPAVSRVVNGATFADGPVAPGAWVSVFGQNLSTTAAPGRIWTGAEIVGTQLPTALDGTSVRIGGRAAAVYYVSPGQLNVQVPDVPADGPATVEVSVDGVVARGTVTIARAAPALFQIGTFGGAGLPAAVTAAGGLIAPAGSIPGARPAAAGELIALFGTGFGPTVAPAPAGVIPTGAPAVTGAVVVTVGGVRADVLYAGLVGAGLNQVNIRVPALRPGTHPVAITVGGVPIQTGLVLAVN